MNSTFAHVKGESVTAGAQVGLAAVKPQGVRPGNPKLDDARANSFETRKQQADHFALEHGSDIVRMRAKGHSFRYIAELLNDADRPGPRGGKWWPKSVSNLIGRYEHLLCDSREAGRVSDQIIRL